MSTNNKKSLASQALLEMEDIKKAIKEESKNTLKAILNETVKDALRESIEDDEDDYEVEDEKNDDAKSDKKEGSKKSKGCCDGSSCDLDEDGEEVEDPNAAADPNAQLPTDDMAGDEAMGAEQPENPEQAPEEGGEEDEWQNFNQYQVPGEENTYDLTGEQDYDQVVKVYKLLKDTDQVVVKKDGNKVQLQDNETGNEYVIDLGGDDEEAEAAEVPQGEEGEESAEGLNEEFDFEFDDDEIAGMPDEEMPEDNGEELIPDDEEEYEFDEFEGDPNMDDESEPEFDLQNNNRFEGKQSRKKIMKENKKKETLYEIDLGYTDNYQSKDPIQGLSTTEPSKSGKSWEKGVPTGNSKPWAGETKSKGDPFKNTQKVQGSVNEMDDLGMEEPAVDNMEEPVEEATNVGGAVQQRTSSKSHIPSGRKEHGPKVKRHVSAGGDYNETVNENVEKLMKENQLLKKQVKALKEGFKVCRNNLSEAYMTNVNLGKITKLFLENTTSQSEKVDIINRFSNEAKTVEQAQALFESINKELKKGTKTPMTESTMTAQGSKTLNEDKVYKSQDLLDTLDFMRRMENC